MKNTLNTIFITILLILFPLKAQNSFSFRLDETQTLQELLNVMVNTKSLNYGEWHPDPTISDINYQIKINSGTVDLIGATNTINLSLDATAYAEFNIAYNNFGFSHSKDLMIDISGEPSIEKDIESGDAFIVLDNITVGLTVNVWPNWLPIESTVTFNLGEHYSELLLVNLVEFYPQLNPYFFRDDIPELNITDDALFITVNLNEEIVLSNKSTSDPDGFLSGTLSLYNIDTPELTHLNQPSPSILFARLNDSYIATTHSEVIDNEKQITWTNDLDFRLTTEQFQMEQMYFNDGLSAWFEEQHEISITAIGAEISPEIQDPWYVRDDGSQTGEDWISIVEFYNIFLNQNVNFNPGYLIYSLRTSTILNTDTEGFNVFAEWVGDQVDFGGGNTTTTARETDVVFLSGSAGVEAAYYNVSTGDPNVTLSENDEYLGMSSPPFIENGDGTYQVFKRWQVVSGICTIANINQPDTYISSISSDVVIAADYYQNITVANGSLRYEYNEFHVDFEPYFSINNNTMTIVGDVVSDPNVDYLVDDLYLTYDPGEGYQDFEYYHQVAITGDNAHLEGVLSEVDISAGGTIEFWDVYDVTIPGGTIMGGFLNDLLFTGASFTIGDNTERTYLNVPRDITIRFSGPTEIVNTTGFKITVDHLISMDGSEFVNSTLKVDRNVNVSNSTISNTEKGLSMGHEGNVNINIDHCVFNNISEGMVSYCYPDLINVDLTINSTNNTLVNTGNFVSSSIYHSSDIHLNIVNTILDVDNLITGLDHHTDFILDLSYSNLYYCGDLSEEYFDSINLVGNQTDDPLFVDPSTYDFHLQPSSPCINAGNPASPLDPDLTRADIGAYYYDQLMVPTLLSISGEVGTHPTLSWEFDPFDHYQHHEIWREFVGPNSENVIIDTENTGSYEDGDFTISQIDEEPDGRLTYKVTKVDPGTGEHQRVNYQVRAVNLSNQPFEYSNQVHTYRHIPGAIWKESDETTALPTEFALRQNYPNPFNPTTTIEYDVPADSYITLTIYDLSGRVVAELVSGFTPAGRYKLMWNGTNQNGDRVPSGMYLFRMKSGGFVETKKLVLLK